VGYGLRFGVTSLNIYAYVYIYIYAYVICVYVTYCTITAVLSPGLYDCCGDDTRWQPGRCSVHTLPPVYSHSHASPRAAPARVEQGGPLGGGRGTLPLFFIFFYIKKVLK